jgi:hypothetical protein
LFFFALAVDAVLFNDDNVLEKSFDVSATFVAVTGLL